MMNTTRLRVLIRKYGDWGVFLVGCFLLLHALRQRKHLAFALSVVFLAFCWLPIRMPPLTIAQRNDALITAIFQEDTSTALSLLEQGADPNTSCTWQRLYRERDYFPP